MSTRSLEEGSGADNDPQRDQRLPTQRRAAAGTSTRHSNTTRTQPDSPPLHAAAASSVTLPPSSAAASSSVVSSPYFALLVTLVLFLVVLSASSYVFLRLQRQHPDHLFTPAAATTTASPLLSQHPAYQQLQRELAGQYQQMLTLAKGYMTDDEWREFQAEAVRIDSHAAVRELQQQQQAAAAPASNCPPCPLCSDRPVAVEAANALSERTTQTDTTAASATATVAGNPTATPAEGSHT